MILIKYSEACSGQVFEPKLLCLFIPGKIMKELGRTRPLVNCNGDFVSEILCFKEKIEGKRSIL